MLNLLKKSKTALLCLALLPAVASLSGCARPNDEDMVEMLGKAYQCKWIRVDQYKKTDSLPGIWTYVAQYEFSLRFVEDDAGAYKFIRGLHAAVPGERDWKKLLAKPAARAYLRDKCAPPAQRVLEQVAVETYKQIAEGKQTVKVPKSVPLTGWAETTSGRGGWSMEMRRDKVKQDYVYAAPVPRAFLQTN